MYLTMMHLCDFFFFYEIKQEIKRNLNVPNNEAFVWVFIFYKIRQEIKRPRKQNCRVTSVTMIFLSWYSTMAFIFSYITLCVHRKLSRSLIKTNTRCNKPHSFAVVDLRQRLNTFSVWRYNTLYGVNTP